MKFQIMFKIIFLHYTQRFPENYLFIMSYTRTWFRSWTSSVCSRLGRNSDLTTSAQLEIKSKENVSLHSFDIRFVSDICMQERFKPITAIDIRSRQAGSDEPRGSLGRGVRRAPGDRGVAGSGTTAPYNDERPPRWDWNIQVSVEWVNEAICYWRK